jgi:hypothetical protein
MRSLRMVGVVVLGALLLGALLLSSLSGGTATAQTAGPPVEKAKAKNACGLLAAQEITAIFDDAPLDPGPTKVALSTNGAKNFTQCQWNDELTTDSVPQLIARVSLARDVTKSQAKRLSTPQPAASGRAITGENLRGIGSKGVIEVNEDGSYAAVGGLKDDDYFIVSVNYLGAPLAAPITDLDILALARTAAKRV